ncbi:MAG: aminotransferase class V-fold PLP-dependent enzyme, partial [Candidatus Promineifilaceae bacterium]
MTYSSLFHIPQGIYLLSHSVGCLPKTTIEAQNEFFHLWQTKGGNAWDDWLAAIDAFCDSLAALFNGRSDQFCPQVNISSAVTKIIASLPPRPGKNIILLSELDFPSIGFTLEQAQRLGYEIRRIPANDGSIFPLERWADYLTPDVQVALITHVLYGNSYRNPVKEIIALARQQGIYTIVDIAQASGIVPINVQEWNADFIAGSCIKWLCGGPGAGFMWVNDISLSQLRPLDVGWFSHENPFEFDITHFRYAPNARRFWGGTPSVLPYIIARSGIEQIRAIGLDTIQAHNHNLTDHLIHTAQENDWPLLTPTNPAQRGGTICIGFSNAAEIVHALAETKIKVDFRPSFGVRFSPH